MSSVDKEINKILADGYENGLGIQEISKNIQDKFSSLEYSEAERIARTESHSAHQKGIHDYLLENSEYKKWSSSSDARTRDTHRSIHGEITKVTIPFSNGLMYPGDKNGSISEWINCRCSETGYNIPLGKMVPSGMSHFRESDLINDPSFGEGGDLENISLEDALTGNYPGGPNYKPSSTTAKMPAGFNKLKTWQQDEYKGYLSLVKQGKMDKKNPLIKQLEDKMKKLSKTAKPTVNKPVKKPKTKPKKDSIEIEENVKLPKQLADSHLDEGLENINYKKWTFLNGDEKLIIYEDISGVGHKSFAKAYFKQWKELPASMRKNVNNIIVRNNQPGYEGVVSGKDLMESIKTIRLNPKSVKGYRSQDRNLKAMVHEITHNFDGKNHTKSLNREYINAILKDAKSNMHKKTYEKVEKLINGVYNRNINLVDFEHLVNDKTVIKNLEKIMPVSSKGSNYHYGLDSYIKNARSSIRAKYQGDDFISDIYYEKTLSEELPEEMMYHLTDGLDSKIYNNRITYINDILGLKK